MLEHGVITAVRYEDGVVVCDVQPVRATSDYKSVPVMKTFSGAHRHPNPGESVIMSRLDDGERVIIGYMSRNEDAIPDDLKPGELTIQVDEDTKVELDKQSDGSYDLNVSASGDVRIEPSDGDVKIDSANGNVLINGIDFSTHTHDHSDSTISDTDDGSGVKSTTTKTTSGPQ